MIVTEYNSAWPAEFEAISAILRDGLGSLALRIHHVGSTAIPGMIAKPILDIDIEIASRSDLPATIAALQTLGYDYQGEKGIVGRHAFGRSSEDAPRCAPPRSWMIHHLYVCPSGSRELRRHLHFRDCLRGEPNLAARYAAIKMEASGLRQACAPDTSKRRRGLERRFSRRVHRADCRSRKCMEDGSDAAMYST